MLLKFFFFFLNKLPTEVSERKQKTGKWKKSQLIGLLWRVKLVLGAQ